MKNHVQIFVALMLMLATTSLRAEDQNPENISFDGLVRIEGSPSAMAYADPDADFSMFRRVSILEPYVAFRSNWQRDQNRSQRGSRISTSDMDRIKADVGRLFMDVFTERLEAGGYEVVNFADEDVLVVRPAIIDLDITAPDTQTAGRSRTYTSSTGAATLYVELFDSRSGDIVGRAADRRTVRNGGNFATQSNRVRNSSEARRVFRVWADRLVDFLHQHYVKAGAVEE